MDQGIQKKTNSWCTIATTAQFTTWRRKESTWLSTPINKTRIERRVRLTMFLLHRTLAAMSFNSIILAKLKTWHAENKLTHTRNLNSFSKTVTPSEKLSSNSTGKRALAQLYLGLFPILCAWRLRKRIVCRLQRIPTQQLNLEHWRSSLNIVSTLKMIQTQLKLRARRKMKQIYGWPMPTLASSLIWPLLTWTTRRIQPTMFVNFIVLRPTKWQWS